jgi:hypothetical protein
VPANYLRRQNIGVHKNIGIYKIYASIKLLALTEILASKKINGVNRNIGVDRKMGFYGQTLSHTVPACCTMLKMSKTFALTKILPPA